jgi:hypothetical protein
METANSRETVEENVESTRHDAILLYSMQDLETARELHRTLRAQGFRVWFADEDWQPGKLLSREINTALERSSVVLLCLGGTGVGNYQGWETSASITGATQGQFQLIPIYLPGFSADVFKIWPMVREIRPIDLRDGLQNRLEIGKLVAALAASRSRAPENPPQDAHSAASAATAPPIVRLVSADAEITSLAQTAIQHGVTFFVGPTVPDRHDLAVVNPEAIAADLLCDLGLMDPARTKGGLIDHIMMAPHAAFLFTLKKGGIAAKEITRRLALRSVGEPATYVRMAETLKQLVQLPIFAEPGAADPPVGDVNPNEKRKLTIVTTNVDVALERSLLKVGLPFSRVVLHRHDSRLLACTFTAVEHHPDGRLTITGDGKRATTRRFDELAAKDQAWLKENYVQLSTTELPFERFFKSYEVNRAIREVWSQARIITGAEVLSLQEPILIKVHGSYDVADSSIICADHYFETSRRSPELVSSFGPILGHAAALMIGYTLTEPEFIHLYQTWLRHPFELSSSSARVAMLDPSARPLDGQDRIYQLLVEEMQREAPRRFKVTPIRASVSDALEKLTAAIREASQSPWLM